ncbi:MAG: beta-lactamase family protein [Planctomycetota bacterium]|jgi:CubicO group peptidase (beta-lactamase class C family)|nr:beta-lactamase family protein [Planctomycetota bacterium]
MTDNTGGSRDLERASPAEMNVDPGQVLRYIEALDGLHCHSVMVLRKGKVITEGWWKPYRSGYEHILYSVSKSFVSMAIGFAVQERLLSLDERLVDIFGDVFPCEPCGNMVRARIRHLLTMSLGHKGVTDLDFYQSGDWLREALFHYLETEPGTNFFYDNRCTFLSCAILQKRAGMTVHDYLRPRLFEPLGITGTSWETNSAGINAGGWGLRAKTEDLARFGLFLQQRGAWGGKQLLSGKWIDEASARHIDTRGKSVLAAEDCWRGYGYLFWRSSFPGAYRGDGALGQSVIVMPDQEMVVAITAGNGARAGLLERTWDTLCPGIDSCGRGDSGTEAEQALLDAKLASLTIPHPEGKPGLRLSALKYSGQAYRMAPNKLGITKLSVQFGDIDDITLWIGESVLRLRAGHGEWEETDTGLQPGDPSDVVLLFHKNVAGSAAWRGDEYVLKLAYTRTPYVDALRLRFDAAGVTGEYECHPVFPTRAGLVELMGRPESQSERLGETPPLTGASRRQDGFIPP